MFPLLVPIVLYWLLFLFLHSVVQYSTGMAGLIQTFPHQTHPPTLLIPPFFLPIFISFLFYFIIFYFVLGRKKRAERYGWENREIKWPAKAFLLQQQQLYYYLLYSYYNSDD